MMRAGPPSPQTLLEQTFRLPSFRPGQERVIAALLRPSVKEGGQKRPAALAVFPTGGGKSLCYQLPALCFDGLTVVISPLIALMKDQIDALQALGISAARLDSSLTLEEHRAVTAGVKDGSLKLLYVAPERFANERFLRMLQGARISLFAVDEAHSISEWGHNFRPDYLKLAEIAADVGAERVLALTATATPAVVKSICQRFDIDDDDAVVTGFYRANLFLRTSAVTRAEKDRALLAVLAEREASQRGPTIVYVTLQKTAMRVAAMLREHGHDAHAYHAGLSAETRTEVQDHFMGGGPQGKDDAIVVATIAFGMGIDKANVRAVLHYDLPKSLEGYSQEIGRAGRDGLPSLVHLLACTDDALVLQGFACGDTPTRESVRALVDDVHQALHTQRGAGPAAFEVELGAWSLEHDLRPLVQKTALTHLELMGLITQSTPRYGTYKVRPTVTDDDGAAISDLRAAIAAIVARFAGQKGAFVREVLTAGKIGKSWITLALDDVVGGDGGHDRGRVVAALEFLGEQKLVTLEVSQLRHTFVPGPKLPATGIDVDAVTDVLMTRFAEHETRELARIDEVTALVGTDGCQTNALVAHFGETRSTPCGHCTWCATKQPTVLPPPTPTPTSDMVARVERGALAALATKHPAALSTPRQQARFLCGLSSPALSAARLGKHPLNGALDDVRFHEVLAWLEG